MRDSIERLDTSPRRQLSGRHVLIIFCSFFGVIFVVNGYFLFSALVTHTVLSRSSPIARASPTTPGSRPAMLRSHKAGRTS